MIKGAEASWGSVSQVILGKAGKPSSVSDVNDGGDIVWAGELTAALNVSGAGGLDTGSEQASKWYAVWAIGDSTGVKPPAALFSLSMSAPTLPTGYNLKRLVWAVKNDAASAIIKFYQTGKGSERRCWYDYGTQNLRVVDAGSQTAWTAVACSAYVPPGVEVIHLQVKFMTGTLGLATDDCRVRRKGASDSQASPAVGVKSGSSCALEVSVPCDDDQMIEYKVDQSGTNKNVTTIVVRGWDLSLE
jgi:hypothetical protein